MRAYNKLVRDRIPEIITAQGEQPIVRTLCREEFRRELNKKLQEEIAEYLASESIEELADILEVIHSILQSQNKTFLELEEFRLAKKRKRGGFENQIFLKMVK